MAQKNKHLDHLEDRIILDGVAGGMEAIKILKEMGKLLSGKPSPGLMVTTKWDGAPAIVCGWDPADGQFFVGTKSVFAKQPKLMKSQQQIIEEYNGALIGKLSACLQYLPSVVKKGVVLQGDLMFTNDKRTEFIEDKKFITFRPNTITYAADPITPLGKDIERAQLGIVFHTKYEGDTITDMRATFRVNDDDFKSNSQVWCEKAAFKDISGAANFTPPEKAEYDAQIRKAEGSLKQAGKALQSIQSGKKALAVDTEFLKYFNNYVRQGSRIPSVKTAFDGFYKHLYNEYDKVTKKYKTGASIDKKVVQYLEVVQNIQKNEQGFKMIIAAYMNLQAAKMMLIRKMQQVGNLRVFVDMGGGDYKCTTQEGFVAISDDRATKLIDRLEFSKLNFSVPKQWG